MNNVVNINMNKSAGDLLNQLKLKLDAKQVVIVSVNNDGTFGTLIPLDILDIDLCYAIDCLKVRRRIINDEINGM